MEQRFDLTKLSGEAFAHMVGLEGYLRQSGLEQDLLKLVKTRASQINGCAFCLDMHTKDARAAGEQEQRLYLLAAWREAPCYSARERAALGWTEALTRLPAGEVNDGLYAELQRHFSIKEIADLSWAITTINAWNRLMIACGMPAGHYQPGQYDRA
jgi:AhpD family alkylhydroperoxidase